MIVAPNYVGYYSPLMPQKQPHARMASLQSAPRDGGSVSLPNPTSPFSWNSAHFCLHSAYPAMPRRGVSLPPSIFPPTRLSGAIGSAPRATEPPWVFHSHSAYRPSAARSPPRVVSSSSPAQLITYLRAFNIFTGKELWRKRLPGGGQATPMTYISERSGRQFVVIVAGGHSGIGTTRGDSVVAFTLPKSSPRH